MYVIVIDAEDLENGRIEGPTFDSINEVIEYLDEHPEIMDYLVTTI